jgi:hypothetical protein
LLGNRQYCYPLTVTDHASRFLLTCEALSSTRENYAFTVFERLFRERGHLHRLGLLLSGYLNKDQRKIVG